MMIRFALTTLAVAAAMGSRPEGQEAPSELELLLDRLGRYLVAYEGELSAVVADERYEQHEIRVLRRGRTAVETVQTRKLDSDVAFLRLPDGASWFGVRDVRRVDGRAVDDSNVRLVELMKRLNTDLLESGAAKIVAASSQYNLGGMRTINMPTTVLEILHPQHHVQFIFKLRGQDRIDGTSTTRVDFEEFDVPTLINGIDGEPLFIRGTAWVEPGTGRLWRAQIAVRLAETDVRFARGVVNRLRVDFMLHPELKVMVPKEMSEDFFVPGGRGSGRARYSNYRRFSTSARIVPER